MVIAQYFDLFLLVVNRLFQLIIIPVCASEFRWRPYLMFFKFISLKTAGLYRNESFYTGIRVEGTVFKGVVCSEVP